MTTRVALATRRKTLATRPLAVEIRADVEEAVLAGDTVELDFSDVLAASSSFLDELVGQLGELANETGGQIRVENASPEILGLLDKTVERRRLRASVMLPCPA